jgi:hypothetical protein
MDQTNTTTTIQTSEPVVVKSKYELRKEDRMKRYLVNSEIAKGYNNTLRRTLNSILSFKEENVSYELYEKYKHHLSDVVELQNIVKRLPIEMINEVIKETLNNMQEEQKT